MFENYETFTPEERELLDRFVTNTDQSIFVLHNLPEVIKGALFSRYSRSKLGLRSLLLKEFIAGGSDAHFKEIAAGGTGSAHQLLAIQKAQNFYDRILDGYGDDSIGELGGAHLAVENISMLAAKAIEDCRIGGSPLEKSTRYIAFDQKVNGSYLYYKEPTLLASKYKDLFLTTCDRLFDTYCKLIPPLTSAFEQIFPRDEATTSGAYTAALRAKVLDCLRGLLPAGTLTNMGIYGNGRFFESLLHKLQNSPLKEMEEIGALAYRELFKILPSFIRRADPAHKTFASYRTYSLELQEALQDAASPIQFHEQPAGWQVKLLDFDPRSPEKVAAALLYEQNLPLLSALNEEQVERILDACAKVRKMRRHKSPRALEHASFTFEIVADFGSYRDLHRHRILTQERNLLNCSLGFYIPEELEGTPFEQPYREALESAKEAFDQIAQDFPLQAQYLVPMAYNVRWYFHVNLRSLQWLTELRSQAAGHPSYRKIAQEMVKEVTLALPPFGRFFAFVDTDGHSIGRLEQEKRKEKKRQGAATL